MIKAQPTSLLVGLMALSLSVGLVGCAVLVDQRMDRHQGSSERETIDEQETIDDTVNPPTGEEPPPK